MTVTIKDVITIRAGQTRRFYLGSKRLLDSARATVSQVNATKRPLDIEKYSTTSDVNKGIIWVTAIRKEEEEERLQS